MKKNKKAIMLIVVIAVILIVIVCIAYYKNKQAIETKTPKDNNTTNPESARDTAKTF